MLLTTPRIRSQEHGRFAAKPMTLWWIFGRLTGSDVCSDTMVSSAPTPGLQDATDRGPEAPHILMTTVFGRNVFRLAKTLATLVALQALMFFPSTGRATASDTMQTQVPLVPSEENAKTKPIPNLYPEWWGSPPKQENTVPCKDPGQCVACHEEQSRMDASHALPCVRCHRGNSQTDDPSLAHKDLIKDPGDLRFAQQTCGTCHPDQVRRVQRSPMALAPRMVNHTRFAFGAQKAPLPSHAVMDRDNLTQVPPRSQSGNLGDDLLRRSCLRCHLYTSGSQRWGEHRGQGCSACHIAYPNTADGKPRSHALVRNAGMTACLKCHNANHVGADFVGLFEKDYHRGFRSPIAEGKQPPTIYGSEQHRLTADLHFRAGMQCTDCHTTDEIHGSGTVPSTSESQVQISCAGCHVRGDHPAILKDGEGNLTLLKGNGRRVPRWDPLKIPHKIEAHQKRLTCSACHAAWSFQDYGLHLMLEERADYWKWAPTAAQNDPQIQALLKRNVGTYAELIPPRDGQVPPKPLQQWEAPVTRDWLTGESLPGAWFRGFTARRWERPPLGVDRHGKVSIMRPMFQYVVSHVDAEANLLLDRQIPTTGGGFPALIMNPYTPHTTTKTGRQCQECHGSTKAAGLGEGLTAAAKTTFTPLWSPDPKIPGHAVQWDALVDQKGTQLQWSTHPGAGPLDQETIETLLHPSKRHRALWYRYLKESSRPIGAKQ